MNKTHKLTFAAICAAIIIVFLLIGAYIRTGTLTIYFISTLLIMLVVLETDKIHGVMSYISSGLIAYIILPDKIIALTYIVFFGGYGIVKSIAEGFKNNVFDWLLKLVYFNVAFYGIFAFISANTLPFMNKFPLWAVWVIGNVALIFYDILLSFAVSYYNKFIKNKLKFIRK